jgi:ATP:ADP antiporter, AAA family
VRTSPEANPSAERSALHRLLGAQPGELGLIVPAVAMGFLLFSGYSILKPLRDTANAAIADNLGEKAVASITTATLVAMAIATLLSAGAITLLKWKRFFVLVQFVWLAGVLGFAAAFQVNPGALEKGGGGWLLSAGFIVAVNVFNLLSLSFMWSRLSDLFAPEQAKRVYPIIGLGITLGAIAGSFAVAQGASKLPAWALLTISATLLTASCAAAWVLAVRPDAPREQPPEPAVPTAGKVLAGAGEGVAAVARSPYLLGLCVYIFLYTTTGTIIWFEQNRIVRAAEVTAEARTATFATIDLYTNLVTITLQGLAAGRIITWLGVGRALTITPITTAIGVAALWLAPQLLPLIMVQVGRKGLHFAIDRPARESLYTVLGRAERHKAKGFIDTFVYRLGDQAGTWLQAYLGALGPVVIYLTVGVCLVWGALGVALGRSMKRREVRQPAAVPQPIP